MSLKYTDKPYGGRGQTSDWRTRFPAHSQPMNTAPVGSRPIRLYEANGASRWGLFYQDAWRGGQNRRDADGVIRWRLDGSIISNPVRWSSS